MSQPTRGRCHRTDITLAELLKLFPDDAAAKRWFTARRGPGDSALNWLGSAIIGIIVVGVRLPGYSRRTCST